MEGRVARRQGTQPLCGGVQGACAEGEGAAATPTGSGGVFTLPSPPTAAKMVPSAEEATLDQVSMGAVVLVHVMHELVEV